MISQNTSLKGRYLIMKDKYVMPKMSVRLFKHENIVTVSAITATENALKSGDITANGNILSASDTILSICF